MTGTRSALLISSGQFADTGVPLLRGVENDILRLREVLSEPTIGSYDVVQVVENPSLDKAINQIAQFFAGAGDDDLLLLYFTGYSVLDSDGRLYFVVADTDHRDMAATALTAVSVAQAVQTCRARQVAIVLDSCHSGAFPNTSTSNSQLVDADYSDNGPKVFVLSAAEPTGRAFESVDDSGLHGGTFTSALVRGLRTGAADLDGDGLVHLDELYSYVAQELSGSPSQSPTLSTLSPGRFLFGRVSKWSVQTRGHGDRPPTRDLLQRGAMLDALVDLVSGRGESDDDRDGPTVIALDGAWGTGKTSLIALTEQRLADLPVTVEPGRSVRRLCAQEASRALAGRGSPLWTSDMMDHADPSRHPVITTRFEPWAHQTGEQVWAGLARSLLDSLTGKLLPPNSAAAERYWFQRNLNRIDRTRLRRTLRKAVFSPLLAVAALALVVPIVAQLARSTDTYRLAWWVEIAGSNIAVLIVVAVFVAGLGHTVARYRRPATNFLPADLFVGPILSTAFADGKGAGDEALRDPYYNARSGYLYLVQHDVFAVLKDVESAGHSVVVFIDDLDRCLPSTTAEVFEAINLFVTRTFPVTRFVLCLDTAAVAAHLDHVHVKLTDQALHGDDPSPGWSFLRKLVQLPIPIPYTSPDTIEETLDDLIGSPKPSLPQLTLHRTTQRGDATPSTAGGAPPAPVPSVPQREPEVNAAVVILEHDHRVRDRIVERLRDQPEPSVRETKRLITTWQYYVRVLIRLRGLDRSPLFADACALVVLAEIVTRWPAAQRGLHRRIDGQHGMYILAKAVDDDWEWMLALRQLDLHTRAHTKCAKKIRELLHCYRDDRLPLLAAELM